MFSLSLAGSLTGGRFRVCGEPFDGLSLTLEEVKDSGSNASIEQFSLLFKGPVESALPQGMYQLQEERIGTVEWFLVPVGKETDAYLYEAIFSLLHAPGQ